MIKLERGRERLRVEIFSTNEDGRWMNASSELMGFQKTIDQKRRMNSKWSLFVATWSHAFDSGWQELGCDRSVSGQLPAGSY